MSRFSFVCQLQLPLFYRKYAEMNTKAKTALRNFILGVEHFKEGDISVQTTEEDDNIDL